MFDHSERQRCREIRVWDIKICDWKLSTLGTDSGWLTCTFSSFRKTKCNKQTHTPPNHLLKIMLRTSPFTDATTLCCLWRSWCIICPSVPIFSLYRCGNSSLLSKVLYRRQYESIEKSLVAALFLVSISICPRGDLQWRNWVYKSTLNECLSPEGREKGGKKIFNRVERVLEG